VGDREQGLSTTAYDAGMTDSSTLRAALSRELHLWHADIAVVGENLLAAYRELLTAEERARNERFVFERDRRQDLVTRALVRTVLSTYRPEVDPRDWRFEVGKYGRPAITAPVTSGALHFNLSHAGGVVVCLVGERPEIGVDVEDTQRTSPTIEIADRFFSPAEATALRALSPERQQERFFVYWTLKEAYIKARGLGLQIPLDQFTMCVDEGEPATIAFGPEIDDDPSNWQLLSRPFGPRHWLAAAIRRRGPDLPMRLLPTVPLADSDVCSG
jgi:4'-phosphopantetheinyl transferase